MTKMRKCEIIQNNFPRAGEAAEKPCVENKLKKLKIKYKRQNSILKKIAINVC